jgi:hypothetical protein
MSSPFTPVGRLGSGGGALLRNPAAAAAAAAADRAAALAAASAAGAPGRSTLPRLLCFDALEGVPIAVERLMQRIAAEAAAAAPGGHAAYAAELDHLLRSGVAPAAMTVLRVQPPRAAMAAAESVFVSQSALQRAAAEPAAAERPGIAKRFAPERRGDWMLRPIGSDEVPILVRLLVALSQRANAALGIAPPAASSLVGSKLECVPPEWAPERLAAALRWCAARGWRVDLRFLAEKTTLVALAVLLLALRITAAIARALAAL